MTLELNITHLIGIGTFLLTSFVGSLWALIKIISSQQQEKQKEGFTALTQAINSVGAELRKEVETTRQLEVAFLAFKAELPRDYVRRDDFIRSIGTIEARIDNFALRMERALTNKGTAL